MQENKGGKTKGKSGKENHQGPATRAVVTKALRPLHKAITPVPLMMDQTRVVEEEEERVSQVGDQREETLSTQKSR